MPKQFTMLICLLLMPLALLWATPTQAQTPTDSANSVRILQADATELLLEFTPPQPRLVTVTRDGQRYQRLELTGWPMWGEAGSPQLPFYATMLGMPAPGQPHLEIVSQATETESLALPLLPYPTEAINSQQFTPDPAAYRANRLTPPHPATIAETGLLGDQPVLALHLFPWQYNPATQELHRTTRLLLRVTFPHAESRQAARGTTSADFEALLRQNLLNYESLPRPPLATKTVSPSQFVPAQDELAVKLLVEETGLYRVGYSDLAGIAPDMLTVDPNFLALTNNGDPVAIFFDGDSDAQFESGETFVFYGEAVDNPYSRYNVYRLYEGTGYGLRIQPAGGLPAPFTPASHFQATQHVEQNNLHWQAPPNGQGEDHWFWSQLDGAGTATTASFDLPNLATAVTATNELRLKLYGSSFGDYRMQLYLNNNALLDPAEQTWSGREARQFAIPIEQSMLQPGSNQLRIENLQADSEFYFNGFAVDYQAAYTAVNDALYFTTPQVWTNTFHVDGFTDDYLYLFDISRPQRPVYISGLIGSHAGAYRLRFTYSDANPATFGQSFYAATRAELKRPGIQVDTPSNWRSAAGASYIIVTHPQFYDTIQPLADYRRQSGQSVAVIKTDDLYDEFNHGQYHPQAIKDFLAYAYANWNPRPVYLLLVGDSSLDPKNYRGNSLSDLLPSYYVNTPLFGQAPSDRWFSTVNGNDSFPDLIVGRLPARFSSEVQAMVQKIKAYEQNPPPGDWTRRALLVAHDENPKFTTDMETIADLLPDSINSNLIAERTVAGQPVDEYLVAQINAGALILAYSGHGNETVWAKGYNIFNGWQARNLANGNKTPFMTAANCLTGYFAGYDPTYRNPSLAEAFLLGINRGGIAVFSPSSYGFPTPNEVLQTQFYQSLITDGAYRPGHAAMTAHLNAYSARPDLLIFFQSFNYLGDPALSLAAPVSLALEGHATPDPVRFGEQLTYHLTYEVSGPGKAHDLTLVNTLPDEVTFVAASIPPSLRNGPTLQWNLGDALAMSQTLLITARVNTVGVNHGQQIMNQAELFAQDAGPHPLPISTTVWANPPQGLVAEHDSPTLLGQPTQFAASVGGGDGVSYQWTFANQPLPQTGATTQYTFVSSGTHPVQVVAYNEAGRLTQTVTATVLTAPVISFTTASPLTLGRAARFTPTGSVGGELPAQVTYAWQFGGGQTATDSHPRHSFSMVGPHVITLTVANRLAETTVTGTVWVEDVPLAGLQVQHAPRITLGRSLPLTAAVQQGSNVRYSWLLGDGSAPQTGPAIAHTYQQTGVYQLWLTATNGSGQLVYTSPLTVVDSMPQADFLVDQDIVPGVPRFTTTFESISVGSNLSYQWDFGDGSPPVQSMAVSTTHVYTVDGRYTVTLTVSNSTGISSLSRVISLTRLVQPPHAAFAVSSPSQLGQPLTFRNFSTDGGERASLVTYRWQTSDGFTSTRKQPTHTFSMVGTHTVTLTMRNSVGEDTVTQTVLVRDIPLSGLTLSQAGIPQLGQVLSFTAQVNQGSNVEYMWALDGAVLGHGAVISRMFTAVGPYTLWLTASNSVNHHVLSETVLVGDVPLRCGAIVQSSPVALGQPMQFTGVISQGTNPQLTWQFGDGISSTLRNPSHLYQTAGQHSVVLTAGNSQGGQICARLTVRVVADQPLHGPVRLMYDPPTMAGQPERFVSEVVSGTNLSYQWDFGDGGLLTTTSSEVTHTFVAAGDYPVRLTVSNFWGELVTQTMLTVAVDETIGGVRLLHAPSAWVGQTVPFTAVISGGPATHYAWSLDPQVSDPTLSHQFGQPGSYGVVLTASNQWGQVVTRSRLTVSDVPLAGVAVGHEAVTLLGETTHFTTTISQGTNVVCSWQFGDGEAGSGCSLGHVYGAPGYYTALLTVQNGSNIVEQSVLVWVIAGRTYLPILTR